MKFEREARANAEQQCELSAKTTKTYLMKKIIYIQRYIYTLKIYINLVYIY